MTALRSLLLPLALFTLIPCSAAPVSLTPPDTVLGWAGRDGELVYNITLREADFGDSVRVPVRFTFRSNDNSVSSAGWDGWFSGAIEARAIREEGAKWTVNLLCNKTMYFVPVTAAAGDPPAEGEAFTSADGEWSAIYTDDDEVFRMSRWDGWELEFREGRIDHCITDSGKRLDWNYGQSDRLTSVSTPGLGAIITVAWNGSAVSGITINGSTYGIQSATGELSGITYPDGTDWGFAYDSDPIPGVGGRVVANGDEPLNA